MKKNKSFAELFEENYEKDRREFEEATKDLHQIPYQREHIKFD